jgi:ATP-dependent DNA ligase
MHGRAVTGLRAGHAWLQEVKLDGYRVIAIKQGALVELPQ